MYSIWNSVSIPVMIVRKLINHIEANPSKCIFPEFVRIRGNRTTISEYGGRIIIDGILREVQANPE
jgi:hypothetical protein